MKKKLFTILLSVSLLFSLTGCAKEEPAKEPVKEAQTQENTETEETRTFTDSVGRTVTIPKELKNCTFRSCGAVGLIYRNAGFALWSCQRISRNSRRIY